MDIEPLITAIATSGKNNASHPSLKEIEPLRHFFKSNGQLDYARLDERDGSCTRRELLLRFLVLNAVIDQGPDIIGVRKLLIAVTNALYRNEVRFLHKPLAFFQELGIAIDRILDTHATIKHSARAIEWANENQSRAEKYNLFMDNSKQALNYAIFRWGVPLALPWLLEKDCKDDNKRSTVLLDYLESWESAEGMSQQLKDHERYGLGKAIGDKACHLFAKWMVSSFKLTRRAEPSWGNFSFEAPFDSNAGRVLWRTGYFLQWASLKEYKAKDVVQLGQGKGGSNYIRVTNIRGMKASASLPENIQNAYTNVGINHLKTNKRPPKKFEIQRIQHAYLLEQYPSANLGVAEFDEGLIYIGTQYCFNHSEPLCSKCPINKFCEGYQENRKFIDDFRT